MTHVQDFFWKSLSKAMIINSLIILFIMIYESILCAHTHVVNKDSPGDEIANVNFYAVRPEATRIHWNNAK